MEEARTGLIVPLVHRGSGLGVLAGFDRGPEHESFTENDEQLLRTFAASAANAVALNRSVETDRLRSTIAAADAERKRWARELHDETLQSLGGLRVSPASVLRRVDADAKDAGVRHAIEDIEVEIGNLRAIISELALADPESGRVDLDPELETTAYRVVQEALTNVAKHAQADSVRVSVALSDGKLLIEVRDDGVGFDPDSPTRGFGLSGMRERVYLAGGSLVIHPAHPGTQVRVELPVRRPVEFSARSAANQAAT